MLRSIEEINIHLAEYIRRKREEKGISQRKLAKMCGLGNGAISKIEGSQGYNSHHNIISILKICDALKIDIGDLAKGFFID